MKAQAEGKKIEEELGLTGSDEESAAIARMQAQQRGKMARKEMAEQQTAASKLNSSPARQPPQKWKKELSETLLKFLVQKNFI